MISDTEFTTKTVHDDIEVKLAHTADDGLTGFLIGLYGKRRVLFGEFAQGYSQLVQILLGLRLYGKTDNRIRKVMDSRTIGACSAQIVSPGTEILETYSRTYIAGSTKSMAFCLFECI